MVNTAYDIILPHARQCLVNCIFLVFLQIWLLAPESSCSSWKNMLYFGSERKSSDDERRIPAMPCTTILVGKKASYDGSTMMARNEDAGSGSFAPKRFVVVQPEEQPKHYVSVLSGCAIELPDHPMRYTSAPNALPDKGIWGEAGINACHVAMTATETITSNPRVQGADPLVQGGIGEEDFVTIVLPYIHSAREGVERLGSLLETYGTYEMNGIGFQDTDEIWWMETIGGHHWIARRIPDNCYAVVPNQLGIDSFDLVDAFGRQQGNLCSRDLIDLIRDHHLDLSLENRNLEEETDLDVRAVFGSHEDADHTYNTPRAWVMERYLNPGSNVWDGEAADYLPTSDDIPFWRVPEHKVTVEDIKYVLSNHYQGTPFDPYGQHGPDRMRGAYRPIGINRNNILALTQIRGDLPEGIRDVQWIAMGSNVFNAMIPFYTNVDRMPAYVANTGKEISTENFYWANRLIAAMADSHFAACASPLERYQHAVHGKGQEMLQWSDREAVKKKPEELSRYLEESNQRIADMAQKETSDFLGKVLYQASIAMKNAFARSDA